MWWWLWVAAPPEVYTVDLTQAVLATPAGQNLAAELEAERARVAAQLRAQEALLLREPRPPDYAAQLEKHLAAVQTAEAALEQAQTTRLAPLLAQLRAPRPTPPGTLFLTAQDHLTLGRLGCDRSRWWAAPQPPLTRDPACRVDRVLTVALTQVYRTTRAGQRQAAQLAALTARLQAELDQEKQKVEALEAQKSPQAPAARQQLDQSYQRQQRQLASAETNAELYLSQQVELTLQVLAQKYPYFLWVEADGEPIALPRCDGTALFAAAFDQRDAWPPPCNP